MKNPLILILYVSFIFCQFKSAAQRTCGSHIHQHQKLEANPQLKQRKMKLDKQIGDYIKYNKKNLNAAVMTIPVVFQIVHNGDAIGQGENLSNNQILAQLDQLNADFSRTNSDASNTPAGFQSIAADTEIQFCLATLDPNGNSTTGINRHHINSLNNVNQSACWDPNYIDNRIVKPLIWNSIKYLNIFTLLRLDDRNQNNQCLNNELLGYASFPGSSLADTDAAVHAYFTIGSLDSPNPDGDQNGLGRTATHEIGHWLNLDHIWGGFNGGCGEDDNIADTPLQNDFSTGCPTYPQTDNCNLSATGIMFMNYMDYSDDACMNLFTKGQGDAMTAAIMVSRPGLLNSNCNGANNPDCDVVHEVNGNISSNTYEASQTVKSSGQVANNRVVVFSSKGDVCLDAGFAVVAGGQFMTDNVGCN